MWIAKRTVGIIQLLVNGLLLFGLVAAYVKAAGGEAQVRSHAMNAIVLAFVALNLVSAILLIYAPRPEPREQQVSEQDRFV